MPAYKRALELNPDHYLTRFNLASIYANYKDDYGAAIAEYDRILSASEEDLVKSECGGIPTVPVSTFAARFALTGPELLFKMQDYPRALAEFDKPRLDYPHI